MSGIFYAVGVGCGNPDDITIGAIKVLEESQIIIAPVKNDNSESVSLEIVRNVTDISDKKIIKAVFPMRNNLDYIEYIKKYISKNISQYLDIGKNVAMITLGDVSFYSTAFYVLKVLKDMGYKTNSISGVPSFVSGANKMLLSLGTSKQSVHIISELKNENDIYEALNISDTLIIMKAGKNLELIKKISDLNNYNAKMLFNVGMKDEYLGDIDINLKSYFVTVILKKGQ